MVSKENTGQLYCLSDFCCLAPKFYLTLENPWTIAHKPPLSVGFPRQEYWSGLPFPSPEDLPDLEIKLLSPALTGGFFTTESPGKPCLCCLCLTYYTLITQAIFFSLGLRFKATSQKGQASLVAQKIKNLPAMRQI